MSEKECDCKVVWGFHYGVTIEYCPLHKAAPKMAELITLYLADCQLEHLEYNDDTYNLAIKIGKQLGMPEALAKAEGNK